MRLITVVMVTAVAAAGCGASSSPPSATQSSETTTALATRPAHHHRANAAGPKLTGFGATTAPWNAAHTEVPGFAPGAVYDADPSLPRVNGHVGSRYFAVQHEDGRVLQYEMAFANQPVSDVRAETLSGEFPPDAKMLWFAVKDSCAQMLVQSATLGKALGSKDVGDPSGTALVEFSSGALGNSYDPSRVNDAIFMLAGYTAQSAAPGC